MTNRTATKAAKAATAKAKPPRSASDAEAAALAETAELERQHGIALISTGYIRFTINGEVSRLRPPHFGEHRHLRQLLETIYDEIEQHSLQTQITGVEIQAEFDALAADDQLPPEQAKLSEVERLQERARLRAKDKANAMALTHYTEDSLAGWWTKAWDMLLDQGPRPAWVDGDLTEAPAWLMDSLLPQRVLTHWKQAPTVRG